MNQLRSSSPGLYTEVTFKATSVAGDGDAKATSNRSRDWLNGGGND